MTVCIAAIARGVIEGDETGTEVPVIIAVTDRMMTAFDIESEPPQSKITRIAPRVLALIGGNDSIQAEILTRTRSHFISELDKESRLIPVSEAAKVYRSTLVAYIGEIIQETVLEPVGHTWETYMATHPDSHAQWFQEGMRRVFGDENFLGTETIVAGIDETGAHIFTVDENGLSLRQDRAGFATIGSGALHAKSQFLSERHSPSNSYSDTLLLCYIAKRRAEVAPGVGKDTDLAVLTLSQGFAELSNVLVAPLEKVYERMAKKARKETENLRKRIPTILKEAQESHKKRIMDALQVKIDNWTASGKLEDSPFKASGVATTSKPGDEKPKRIN